MKKEETELPEEESKVILYTTDDGKAQVSLMSRDGRVWLNQKQMAELFAVTKMNISLHIANILKEKELDDSVVKFFFTTAASSQSIPEMVDELTRQEIATWYKDGKPTPHGREMAKFLDRAFPAEKVDEWGFLLTPLQGV